MTNQRTSAKLSPEVRERAVRMVREHRGDHASQWAAIVSIAAKIGCTAQTLNEWIKKSDIDSGRRPGVTTDERERLKALERRLDAMLRALDGGADPAVMATAINGLVVEQDRLRADAAGSIELAVTTPHPRAADRYGAQVRSIRKALRQRKATPSAIARCAEQLGAWQTLRPYLEAMIVNARAGQHRRLR